MILKSRGINGAPRANRSHYEEYITDRLDEWPELTAERIYREIKGEGYTGSKDSKPLCNGVAEKTYQYSH